MTTVGSRLYGKYKILSCVYRINISINWLRKFLAYLLSQFKSVGYSQRVQIILIAWVGDRAGMQCSVRTSSLATVLFSMKNLIACFQVVFCLRNRNLLDYCVTVKYKKKREFFCAQLHRIEFNVPRTNFSIKQPRGKKSRALQNRTRSTLS